MASTKKSMTARVAAGFGAVALTTLTVLGGALPASAAPVDGNVDTSRIGSITVHKFEQPATSGTTPHDGHELTSTGDLRPLEGVTFSVQRVDIDLATNAGWALAAETDAEEAASMLTTDVFAPRTTDEQGLAAFTALPVGVYLVTETDPGDHGVAISTDPFLVSIPMALASDSSWLYDVHVYPKAALASLSMSVDETQAHVLGSTLVWKIVAGIPEIAADGTLSDLTIRGAIDSRLSIVDATIAGSGFVLDAADYSYSVAADGQITLSFTETGRIKLAAADHAQLTITIDTTVTGAGDGIIRNTARMWVNDTTFATATAFTGAAQSGWGNLEIFKHDEVDAPLAGARFSVFATEADATAGTNALAVPGNALTSGTDGMILVEGLLAGDYWIVEVETPVGFQASSTPIAVTVVADEATPGVDTARVDVENTRVPAYTLPITGGTGQAAFMIGGAGLLAAALGFALFRRRKADAEV